MSDTVNSADAVGDTEPPASYGHGWKPDEASYVENTERMGTVSPRLAAEDMPRDANVLGKHCDVRDQRSTSSCVGFADTGAVHARLTLLGYSPPRFSALGLYAVARMLERVGRVRKDPLDDVGSYPFLALTAMRAFGILVENEHSFSEERVNHEIDFDDFQKASQFRLSGYRRIDVSRRLQCMRHLLAGKPIPLGMQVGAEFQQYRKGRGPVGVETGNTGGHMTYLVGYREHGEIFIGCNSWSRDFGDNGFYEIHVSKLEHATTNDLVALSITDAPAPAGSRDAAMDLLKRLHA